MSIKIVKSIWKTCPRESLNPKKIGLHNKVLKFIHVNQVVRIDDGVDDIAILENFPDVVLVQVINRPELRNPIQIQEQSNRD